MFIFCLLTSFDQLALYDIKNSLGVATDLSHISTPCKVEGYLPNDDGLAKSLKGADIVFIPAGVAKIPGMAGADFVKNATTRDKVRDFREDLFNVRIPNNSTTVDLY